MSKKDKPLPKPPKTPFGRKKAFGNDMPEESLLADEIAMAAAGGNLDDYMKKNLPESEYARKLTEMMMGMSGMIQGGQVPGQKKALKKETRSTPDEAQPPEDIVYAVKNADVHQLIDLLRREQKKRSGASETKSAGKTKKDKSGSARQATIEKKIVEQLVKIARENDLSIDWIVFRALKRYVEEYKKTGNL